MKMEKPTVEAVRFNTADVIATSGGVPAGKVLLSGFGNGNNNDNTFQIGTTTYGPSASVKDVNALVNALKGLQPESGNSAFYVFFNSGTKNLNLNQIWDKDGDPLKGYDGFYTWYNDGEDAFWNHD